MDRNFIKVLIEEGQPIVDVPQAEAIVKLNNEVMTLYVKNGLHRGMQPEAFKEEVRVCAVALLQELTSDPMYRGIRDKEIPYIFSNGMKGRLGTDKDFGLSFKNLIRWVEGYIKHTERREALSMFVDEHTPKPAQLPAHELTDEDYMRKVSAAWTEYVAYKTEQRKEYEAIQKGLVKPKPSDGLPKTIGETFGGLPITCLDYGRMRIEYLRRTGYASETESLIDVFERAYRNGGKFEKVG